MHFVTILKALGDETRLRLFFLLLKDEYNVGELVDILRMGQSRISRHLKILTDAKLLTIRRDGLWVFYRVTTEEYLQNFFSTTTEFFIEETFAEDEKKAQSVKMKRHSKTVEFFNESATKWTTMCEEVLGEFPLYEEICEQIVQNGIIVDLGCGTGMLFDHLPKNAKKTYIGVDNASAMLDTAKKKFMKRDDISWRIGDLLHLPLSNNEADVAIFSLVLHHSDKPQELLIETARVLKTGGQLLLADFVAHAKEEMRTRFGDHRLGFEKSELINWLNIAGFTLQEEKTFNVKNGLSVFILNAIKK